MSSASPAPKRSGCRTHGSNVWSSRPGSRKERGSDYCGMGGQEKWSNVGEINFHWKSSALLFIYVNYIGLWKNCERHNLTNHAFCPRVSDLFIYFPNRHPLSPSFRSHLKQDASKHQWINSYLPCGTVCIWVKTSRLKTTNSEQIWGFGAVRTCWCSPGRCRSARWWSAGWSWGCWSEQRWWQRRGSGSSRWWRRRPPPGPCGWFFEDSCPFPVRVCVAHS